MKNNVMQAQVINIKKGLVSFILVACVVVSLLPQSVLAQQNPGDAPASNQIKYLGVIEDQLLFNVNMENENTERCRIIIQDEQGEVFYKQDFKDEKFAKTFGIDKNEIEGKNLVFVLVKGKARHEHVFHVSTNTRVIEDVVVAKQ